MRVELSCLKNDKFMLVADRPFPDFIEHVEFYHDQRLLVVSYESDNIDDALMEHEVPERMLYKLSQNAEIIIFSLFADHEPVGYKVPLINISSNA